jgi:hypothetical protein
MKEGERGKEDDGRRACHQIPFPFLHPSSLRLHPSAFIPPPSSLAFVYGHLRKVPLRLPVIGVVGVCGEGTVPRDRNRLRERKVAPSSETLAQNETL